MVMVCAKQAWPRKRLSWDGAADVVDIVRAYSEWIPGTEFPKLFINAEPGAILTGGAREYCRAWNNQTEVTVSGSHFILEDSGPDIGRAASNWMRCFS